MNMTPMIDILLVLLVIFMVTLPLNQRGLDVALPAQVDGPQPVVPDPNVVVETGPSRELSINRQPVAMNELEERLREIYRDRRDKTLFVMGAATLRYGDIVGVIDAAKGAGVLKVGIVTERMRRAG